MHTDCTLSCQAQAEAVARAKVMLQPPPVLPLRSANGEVIEVNEKLAGAITHRVIFTETSQHKDNQVCYLESVSCGSCSVHCNQYYRRVCKRDVFQQQGPCGMVSQLVK